MTGHQPTRPWATIAAATALNLPLGTLYAFSVFLKPLEPLIGATRAELSLVFGLATIGFTVGMNLAPALFRLGAAPLLVLACAATSTAGIALSAFAGSIVELAIGYGVLFGLGGGVAYILVQQAVNLVVRSHRGLVNGYVIALYPAGAMVAAPVFGWCNEAYGVRTTLAGLALLLALTGGGTAWLFRYSGVILSSPALARPEAAPIGRRQVFWQLWCIFFLAAAAGLMVLSQAAGMVQAYGGSLTLALFGTTYITGCIACARVGGGWLADRFAIPRVMAAAHGFALLGSLTLTLWPGPLVAMFTLAMVGIGYGIVSGCTAAAVAFYWSSTAYGKMASRLYIAWCVAAISLPVIAGWLYDLSGGYRMAVLLAAGGNLIGALVALALPRPAAPRPA
ncbi:MAG: OFA family MFS transporter [Alphaproteobacteria bacterium]|nr:OFA family MFS transporter [Alphaproteobacteria bacterium]